MIRCQNFICAWEHGEPAAGALHHDPPVIDHNGHQFDAGRLSGTYQSRRAGHLPRARLTDRRTDRCGGCQGADEELLTDDQNQEPGSEASPSPLVPQTRRDGDRGLELYGHDVSVPEHRQPGELVWEWLLQSGAPETSTPYRPRCTASRVPMDGVRFGHLRLCGLGPDPSNWTAPYRRLNIGYAINPANRGSQ